MAGLVAVGFLVLAVTPAAQQFVVGYFTRIYFGATSGPVIRSGASQPTGTCAPGSLYLQKQSASTGTAWLCKSNPSSATTGRWIGVGSSAGEEYLLTDYGVVCDGLTATSTANTTAMNNIVTAITLTTYRTGTIRIPATGFSSPCTFNGAWRLGPSTTPWGVAPGTAPAITDIAITLTAPRTATLGFTASSTTITFTGTDLTSADVGNEVFYGTTDAAYQAFDARVIVPTPDYSCFISSVNAGAHTAVCVPSTTANQGTIASAGPTNTLKTMSTTTTGSRTAFITNNHDFTVTDANTLTGSHVGKTMQFIGPALRAPLTLINTSRNADAQVPTGTAPCTNNASTGGKVGIDQGAWSAVTTYSNTARVIHQSRLWVSLQNANLNHTPPTLPTLSDAWWHYADSFQCQNGGNQKLKGFQATITAVTDATHGKFTLNGLTSNSNAVGNFPDSSHTTETNSGAYSMHEWCHGLTTANCYLASSLSLNHSFDFNGFTTAYSNAAGDPSIALSEGPDILPYFIPLDTADVHISLKGEGAYSSILKYTGIGAEPANAPAIIVSRNKNFSFDGFSLLNGETCGSGSCFDVNSRIGIYFGGLPGVGTQTFAFIGRQLEVAGFDQCVLMGDNLGGESSDSSFDQLGLTFCGRGLVMAPGSFNTLDVKVHNILGGFNKIAVENNDGNLIVKDGSFSYNGIDFYSHGFGPMTISGMRSEGPGRFVYGTEPQLSIRDSDVAESQGSRLITGTVTCTPDNKRAITVDFDGDATAGPPTNTFYLVDFSASAIVGADIDKTVLIDLGSGNFFMGYVHSIVSTTRAQLVKISSQGTLSDQTGKTLTLYDTDTCDLVWPSGQVHPNDVGGYILSPDGGLFSSNYSGSTKLYINSYATVTTGKGYFTRGRGGPVKSSGSSDVDPTFFDNTIIELTGGNYHTVIDNFSGHGLIKIRGGVGGNGGIDLRNSFAWNVPVFDSWALPVFFEQPGKAYHLSTTLANIGVTSGSSGTLTSTGIRFTNGTVDDTSTSYEDTRYTLRASNNLLGSYASIQWEASDFEGQVVRGTPQALRWTAKPVTGTNSGGQFFYGNNYPTGPVQAFSRLGVVKTLSEAPPVQGRNLRLRCKFATAATCVVDFDRTESWTYTFAAGVNRDQGRREYTINVTSGNFTVADVGKTFAFSSTSTDYGTRTFYGTVTAIVDATHIKMQQAAGQIGGVFSADIGATNATIGENEPDANYIVFLSCDTTGETFKWGAVATTGFTITSSNAASTATCNALIVR